MEKRVGIVGAGSSGLIACKHLMQRGFDPIIFEAKGRIGGIWTKTIESTKLQTPKDAYQFSDFPWPESVTEEFPNHDQVLQYIESYAKHFGVVERVRFNNKVLGLEFVGAREEDQLSWGLWGGNGEAFGSKGRWDITVEDTNFGSTEVHQVEFVVLCIGRFGDVPKLPVLPQNNGPQVFKGEVMHAKDYSELSSSEAAYAVRGKRVAVVGFQKSALDIAAECARVNGKQIPCNVILREPHWNVPHYLPWGVHLAYLYCTRFSELLVHKPQEGFLLSLLATLLSPVRWGISKFAESYLRWKLPLKKYGMVPNHSFLLQISSCQLSTLPPDFYDKVEEGSILLKQAPKWGFCKEGLILNDKSEPLDMDLVILATGYDGDQKLKGIFQSPTFQKYIMRSETNTLPLYREIIHPRIPQLAVIGYSESLSNLFTSEMRSQWLCHFLDGGFRLPSIKEMEDDLKKWEAYMKSYAGKYYWRSCIGVLHIWYNDQLCKDMGYNPKRKKGWYDELFSPYGVMDYCKL